MGTVLVTGGAGFLGRYIARGLADKGEQVMITYRRSFRTPEVLSDVMGSRVKAVRCDVLDFPELARIIRDNNVDSIVHAAHVSNYEATIFSCLQTNIVGAINVMEAASMARVKKVTYISSSSIAMHGPADSSIGLESEQVPIVSAPTSVVSPSKKIGEVLVNYYGATFGFGVAIIRPGLIYGPYTDTEIGSPGTLKVILEGVIAGKPVSLPDISKNEKVSMVYVRDVAECVALAHEAPKNQHRVYSIDADRTTTWEEIDRIIKDSIPGAKITFGKPNQPPRARDLPENLNITSEFGFKPGFGIKEGLREIIDWYQKGKP